MFDLGVRPATTALLVSVWVALAGCSGGASQTGPAASSAPTPASAAPSVPSGAAVATPEDAVARVVAERPDLAGIVPFDSDRIGGCCWYEVSPADGGFDVEFRVGWGDCPAGCIDEHTWTYRVGVDGSVELVAEGGDPGPPGGIPAG